VNAPSTTIPSREEGERFRRLLLNRDNVAQQQFAYAYLEPLVAWLGRKRPRLDEDLYQQAAEQAIMDFIHNPGAYDPVRCGLWGYLCMAALRDLLNLLKKEARHRRGRQSLDSVAESPDAGNYLGREDDPSRVLSFAEQQRAARAAVGGGLTEPERRALEVMLQGVQETPPYAEALGIAHLPDDEQARQVKRFKDRVKARGKRARDDHEQSA